MDETFFEQMMLVCMDLKTSYLLLEEMAEESNLSYIESVGQ